MVQLQDYITDTADILRDSRLQFTSRAQMIRYINRAREEVAKRSMCLQALVTGQSGFGTSAQPGYAIAGAMIPNTLPGSNPNNENEPGAQATASNSFTTMPGVEVYTYDYAKPYVQQQYQGYEAVTFVFNVAVSWGGYRPVLRWEPWDNLQAYYRSFNLGVTSYPFVWSQKGVGQAGQVWLYPVPNNLFPGEMEWECICSPKKLYSDTDYEAIPEIYQGCVKYYAAYLAYLSQQRMEMASSMRQLFDEQLVVNNVATDYGHVSDYYAQLAIL